MLGCKWALRKLVQNSQHTQYPVFTQSSPNPNPYRLPVVTTICGPLFNTFLLLWAPSVNVDWDSFQVIFYNAVIDVHLEDQFVSFLFLLEVRLPLMKLDDYKRARRLKKYLLWLFFFFYRLSYLLESNSGQTKVSFQLQL